MSGIEVAGLLLGAIPLIVEGFESSQKALVIFKTYRHYPREVVKLDAKIGAQKTVFRNACINLLNAVTNDRHKVSAMLSQPSHTGWQDEHVHATLARQVGALDESLTSCQRTIDQIHCILNKICKEMEAFRSVLMLDEDGEEKTIKSRERYKRLKERIKLGLNKTTLEKQVEELRSFISDFNLMSEQIVKSIPDVAAQASSGNPRISRRLTNLIKYQNVRKASQRLHETLVNRWSCSVHSQHIANISLNGRVDETPSPRVLTLEYPSIVHLEMAIFCYEAESSGEIPIWLEVESTLEARVVRNTLEEGEALKDISNTLENGSRAFALPFEGHQDISVKRELALDGHQDNTVKRKTRRTVRFDGDVSLQLQNLSIRSVPPAEMSEQGSPKEGSPDLRLITDVCEHFHSHQSQSQKQTCMAHLKDTYLQRFYQAPAERCLDGEPRSLEDVITWVSKDPIRMLPRTNVLQLAYTLSTAVLQYHSTPWLSEAWRSRDIVFFGITGLQEGSISLRHPHLNLQFTRRKDKGRATIGSPSNGSSSTADHPDMALAQSSERTALSARNGVLSGFGIVLLEVGFATPWSVLRANVLNSSPHSNDYWVADKLARILANSMGPAYSKIIRKCLGCDFGLGETDLASEDLQERYLLDVVGTLKGLVERFPGG